PNSYASPVREGSNGGGLDEKLDNSDGGPRLGALGDNAGRELSRSLRPRGSGRAEQPVGAGAALAPRPAVCGAPVYRPAVLGAAIYRPARRCRVRSPLGAAPLLGKDHCRGRIWCDHHGRRRGVDPAPSCSGPVLVLGRSLPLSRLLGLLLLIAALVIAALA